MLLKELGWVELLLDEAGFDVVDLVPELVLLDW